ncbi:hypothetical protein F5X96DRAFT_650542 [Biscogniauxia mediterranea]|nr:hypothetical protein F5X96DRAFT_650542 [Biscogniauxia mediterranea]
MSRNRDIRGFLKTVAPPSPQSRESVVSSPQILDLPSSPATPPKPAPRVLSLNDEIKGSDDEDGDSDDSLESISAFIGGKTGPAPPQRGSNAVATPRAKRIALAVHKSPLTLQPAKHKFDLKSLINHTRQDERTDESARRAENLLKEQDDEDNRNVSDSDDDQQPLQEAAARKLLLGNEEEAKGDKIVRAMKRTTVDGNRKWCYFFSIEQPLLKPPRSQFPQRKLKGFGGKPLSDPAQRDQAFIHGLPYILVTKGKALPDELFQWILDEVCVEKNAQLRLSYSNLVKLCSEQTHRLVNDMQLYSMLERIGGPRYAREHSKFESSPELEDPYRDRDWTGLMTFLELLEHIAPNLKPANAISAIQLLIRMSLDPIVATTVGGAHFAAMEALVSALPKSGRQWDTACETICSYLYENTDDAVLRVIPIKFLPKTSKQLLDLRRRMAAEALFHRPGLGSKPLDDVLTVELIRDRLDQPDLKIRHSTNFEELKATITLLDIVIGDAHFIRTPSAVAGGSTPTPTPTPIPIPTPSTTATTTTNNNQNDNKNKPNTTTTIRNLNSNNNNTAAAAATSSSSKPYTDADRRFDAEVDALTFRLKTIHDRIVDSNLVSRKEAKAVVDAVSKRLTYSVRTRPPPKKDIFDMGGSSTSRSSSSVAQRAFMKNWAQRQQQQRQSGGGSEE